MEKKEPSKAANAATQSASTPRSLHTPGPWFVNRYRASIQTADPSKPTISNRPICYLETESRIMPKTTDADARLIAAAPELLRTCGRLHDALESGYDELSRTWANFPDKPELSHLDLLRAAIAKAVDASSVQDGNENQPVALIS
jgi:hypothetical protein